MSTSTRRNANGSVSSVYSGNRIQYLKKEDGQPLWRKDIQYTLLKTIFENDQKVFTKISDGTSGHSFADIYVDAMAKSSKCSQILKEKLLSDGASAVNMAMICLLVNVGRMNTTLNFFPEMRARVRTYHPIPVLQAKQSAQEYKQLQDGPRLKSILKGAMEDVVQPGTIDGIVKAAKPRTNPVNLIFVLAQYAPKVSEMHFFPPRDFFDIFMRTTLSSSSRATAFLWMMWWYLESDFTAEDAKNNPFGAGQAGPDDEIPNRVPAFERLSEEEAALEDVDTPEELQFGEDMQKERHGSHESILGISSLETDEATAILAADMPPTATSARRSGKLPTAAMLEQQHNYRFRASPFATSASDSEGLGRAKLSPSLNRGGSPHTAGLIPKTSDPNAAAAAEAPAEAYSRYDPRSIADDDPRLGRGLYRRNKESIVFDEMWANPAMRRKLIADSSQPRASAGRKSSARGLHLPLGGPLAASGASATGAGGSGQSGKRSRLPTAHQQAIAQSRRDRVNYLLHQNMRDAQAKSKRERQGRGLILDAWIKARSLPEDYDSEEDEAGRWGGLHDMRGDDRDSHDDAGERARELSRGWRKAALALDGVTIPRMKRSWRREDLQAAYPDGSAYYGFGDADGAGGDLGGEDETPARKPRAYRRRPAARGTGGRMRKRISRAPAGGRGARGAPAGENDDKDVEADEDAKEVPEDLPEEDGGDVDGEIDDTEMYDDGEAAADLDETLYDENGDEVPADGDEVGLNADNDGGSDSDDTDVAWNVNGQGEDVVMAEG